MTPFQKMHGLGNDFVILDAREAALGVSAGVARGIADRRRGIGCDQVIVLEPPRDSGDVGMRIFNADGGEVESCGNAARCVGRLAVEESGRSSLRIETRGGVLSCSLMGDLVTVDMGFPRFDWRDIPLAEPRDTDRFGIEVAGAGYSPLGEAAAVNIGNPHCVLFVGDAEAAPVGMVGPLVERNPLFPERANVEFAQVLSPGRIRMRVWERGVGITLACGTGACATMAAAQRRGLCGTEVEVALDGGPLVIAWRGGDEHVFMTGPAAFSFRGEIDLGAFA